MTDHEHIDVEPGMPTNAVSVFGDSGVEEFPVLKAFQQYIDAEQNKARKRMVALCVFFGCLMTVVIAVFLVLLNGVSQRNQLLNDKLFEYLTRDRSSSAVVVQPPSDNSAVYGLTKKLEEIQRKLAEAEATEAARRESAEKAAVEAEAAETAAREAAEKARLRETLEIARLKKELAAERARTARERELKRQAEIEAYRRKHYPDLYESKRKESVEEPAEEFRDDGPVDYFKEDVEDDEERTARPRAKGTATPSKSTGYSIPVEVKGLKTKWRIPNA